VISHDQTRVIDFLSRPATHGGAAVERIDTHASIVFLAGALAYKLKRAVVFDYLDFSSVERRRVSCEAELRLNQRTAPSIYRGVLPVTQEPGGSYALGGPGVPQDWVVVMNRFPQEGLLDRLASSDALALEVMSPLADAIVRLHATAERRPDHGGRAGMAWVIDGNAAGLREFGGVLDHAAVERLIEATRAEFFRRGGLIDARRASGFVRQCHGDLHLRNVVLLNGQPTLFDGVEFNDEIACTDVLYDLAFLLMDLQRRGLPRHANMVWNRYLAETGELAGLQLLPLFLSCRAAVRAKTSATAGAVQMDPVRREEMEHAAREYLTLAERFLSPPAPVLIAIGGLSGSGKTTLAYELAPFLGAAPGAVVLRSDEIRKRLCRVPLLERLGPQGYSPLVTERVYGTMIERAVQAVGQGHTAIADAVFARAADRQAVAHAAHAASVPFIGLWLDAPEHVLIARTAARRLDASDADAAVIARQREQGTGEIEWHRLDASLPLTRVSEMAARGLASPPPAPARPALTPRAAGSSR
jgi:aminoglycoside phosphotransferase family enzyme/predicted kinase